MQSAGSPGNAILTVFRQTGNFTHRYFIKVGPAQFAGMHTFASDCPSQPSIGVTFRDDGTVSFRSHGMTVQIPQAIFAMLSPGCRIGVAAGSSAGAPGEFIISWYNLNFPPSVFPDSVGIHGFMTQLQMLQPMLAQQFWITSDDTLLLILELVPPVSGPLVQFNAHVFDTISGHEIGNTTQPFSALTVWPRIFQERVGAQGIIANMNQSPVNDPLNPADDMTIMVVAPPIADIYSISLSRANNIDSVKITFRVSLETGPMGIGSGVRDSQNDLNNGTGNFRSVTLTLQ
jgi:hypothetical protein